MSDAVYPSKYAPGKTVTAAQRLAEIMVERQARAKGTELPPYFWRKFKDWERAYKIQLRHANGLFKLYEPKAIGNALRTREGRKIYSLGAKWLDALIVEEQRKLDAVKEARAAAPPPPPTVTPSGNLPQTRPAFRTGPSVTDRLRGL